jgi:hypothetical protein
MKTQIQKNNMFLQSGELEKISKDNFELLLNGLEYFINKIAMLISMAIKSFCLAEPPHD